MFAEMADQFLPAPTITTSAREFAVTLRNTPTLTLEDPDFIAQLGNAEVGDEEFRALLDAHRHGRVDNARMRQIAGLDTLGASMLLRRLRDRRMLELHAAGAASFYTLPAPLRAGSGAADPSSDRGEFDADRGEFDADRGELDADRGELDTHRHHAAGSSALSAAVNAAVGRLGRRPRKERLRATLTELCALRPYTPAELGFLVGMRPDKLVERHLSPMVAAGALERLFPDTPNHPDQASTGPPAPRRLLRPSEVNGDHPRDLRARRGNLR